MSEVSETLTAQIFDPFHTEDAEKFGVGEELDVRARILRGFCPRFSGAAELKFLVALQECHGVARRSATSDEGEREEFRTAKNSGGLGSTLTDPISRGRRPRSATPNPLWEEVSQSRLRASMGWRLQIF